MKTKIIYTDVRNFVGVYEKDGIKYVVISKEFKHNKDMHNKIMLEVFRMFEIELEKC